MRDVVWVETRDDPPDPPGGTRSQRHRERATARLCAHAALTGLGRPAARIGSDADGVPTWPVGVVGSITHCAGYRAAAVAASTDVQGRRVRGLGIDAEPHAPLPDGVADVVLAPGERDAWADLPGVHVERLAFSAKEAAYKAVFPHVREPLDPADVVVRLAPGAFSARLATAEPRTVAGSWWVSDGLVLTLASVAS